MSIFGSEACRGLTRDEQNETLSAYAKTTYVDAQDGLRVLKTGDTMTGDLDMGGQLVSGLPTTYPPLYQGDEATSWAQAVDLVQDTVGNLEDPTDPQNATTKKYVDEQDNLRVLKAGDTMSGDLRMSVGSDTVRLLGCDDLTAGKGFSLPLGNLQNQLQFAVVAPPQTQTPVTVQTTDGLLVQINNDLVCQLGPTIK